jgi:putative transposase
MRNVGCAIDDARLTVGGNQRVPPTETEHPVTHPQRKSPRKIGFDYTSDGVYFVTICTQNRLHLFGHIHNDLMCLNAAGGMIATWWEALPSRFPAVSLDSYVVMPNHTHALIALQSTESIAEGNPAIDRRGAPTCAPDLVGIPTITQWFKTMTTNAYMRGVKDDKWEPFTGRLWQRSYHDRFVRDEAEWGRIRQYILCNPALWARDTFFG